ncbi:hypothetical protein ACJ73_03339 [Blastomyces percursus]|uniref:Uncharacterized protein n=1 Tax=Blastomyces percursus TaxID=1658174 RepID=A0A1J9R9V1_9EURO|nr:hypothetical protein ACJ73_03339 [Blastomyces percursus]
MIHSHSHSSFSIFNFTCRLICEFIVESISESVPLTQVQFPVEVSQNAPIFTESTDFEFSADRRTVRCMICTGVFPFSQQPWLLARSYRQHINSRRHTNAASQTAPLQVPRRHTPEPVPDPEIEDELLNDILELPPLDLSAQPDHYIDDDNVDWQSDVGYSKALDRDAFPEDDVANDLEAELNLSDAESVTAAASIIPGTQTQSTRETVGNRLSEAARVSRNDVEKVLTEARALNLSQNLVRAIDSMSLDPLVIRQLKMTMHLMNVENLLERVVKGQHKYQVDQALNADIKGLIARFICSSDTPAYKAHADESIWKQLKKGNFSLPSNATKVPHITNEIKRVIAYQLAQHRSQLKSKLTKTISERKYITTAVDNVLKGFNLHDIRVNKSICARFAFLRYAIANSDSDQYQFWTEVDETLAALKEDDDAKAYTNFLQESLNNDRQLYPRRVFNGENSESSQQSSTDPLPPDADADADADPDAHDLADLAEINDLMDDLSDATVKDDIQ